MRFLGYNRNKKKHGNEVFQIAEKLPGNYNEALAFIQKLQAENIRQPLKTPMKKKKKVI